jgi:GNAT superfamily N-acetyltransferase
MVYQPSAGREAGGSSSSAGAFRIEQATTPAALAEVNRLVANTFGVPLEVVERLFTPSILDTPGLALYLARDGEQAISTLLTTRASRAVGIWNMATVPERQRQGAGRALLTHALAHQQGQGAETFYLLATEAGLPLYEGVGFRILTMPAVWVNGHSDEAPAQ